MSWTIESNSYTNQSWGSGSRVLTLVITEQVNQNRNSSTLNWTFTSSGYSGHYVSVQATNIKINGTTVYQKAYTPYTDHVFPATVGSVSGSIEIPHNENGQKRSVNVVFSTKVGQSDQGATDWAGQSGHVSSNVIQVSNLGYINLTDISVYQLTLSPDANSEIVAERTSSGYSSATIGTLTSGSTLYLGDTLRFTFSANSGYNLATHQINGSDFASGGTHTVADNVVATSTAIQSVSVVGATDAEIGSVSSITITRYNQSYYHSLRYTFGSLSGYIKSDGALSLIERRFTQTSVAFTIPQSFYDEIPNDLSGVCTIVCTTYSSSSGQTQIGTSSCTFTVYVNQTIASPVITFDPIAQPTNSIPYYLTGDEHRLIRYKSDAISSITVTPQCGSSVASCEINFVPVTLTNNTVTATFVESEATRYIAKAIDSRGLSTLIDVTGDLNVVSFVNYKRLTCNPIFKRNVPSSDRIFLSFSGNFYNGYFDANQQVANQLKLRYRYREKSRGGLVAWSSWIEVPAANISYGTNSYQSVSDIDLTDNLPCPSGGFSYQSAWEFQIQAMDGDLLNNRTLSTIPATADLNNNIITVQKGFPVFDWGENDFNINAELRINNVNIFDLVYPVGTIYRSSSNQLPASIGAIGTWNALTSGGTSHATSSTYEWERVL